MGSMVTSCSVIVVLIHVMSVVTCQKYTNSTNTRYTGGTYPRLAGPNYAGREFIFTFGDNKPSPLSYLHIVPYNRRGDDSSANCTVTYYLGESETPQTEHITVSSKGELIRTYRHIVILVTDDEVPPLIDLKSVHIESDSEVTVTGFSKAPYSTEAFTALPVDVLGMEYVIPSSPHQHSTSSSGLKASAMIIVTGVCENKTTTVTYKFPQSDVEYYHPYNASWLRGGDLNVTLERHETVMLQADTDLTGTLITSDCEIAVLSGNKRGTIEGSTGDHMIEMIPPISRLGHTFITSPLYGRTTGEVFKLIGGHDWISCDIRVITVSDTGESNSTTLNISLQTGHVYRLDMGSDEYAYIQCTDSVLLSQYAKSGTNATNQNSAADNKYGDPLMTFVPGIVHYDSIYTVTCIPVRGARGYFDHYISVIIPSDRITGLQIEGEHLIQNDTFIQKGTVTVVNNVTIPGLIYTHLVLQVAKGVYILQHDNPTVTFGVSVYGLKKSESYGYPGGLRLPLTGSDCKRAGGLKYSDPTAAVINDNDDNDCDGIVDEELLDGVDNDGDGVVDEDTSANVLYPPMSEEIVLIEEKPENLKIVSAIKVEEGADYTWSVVIAAVICAAVLIGLIAVIIIYRKSKAKLPAGHIPAGFDNRVSSARMSIRAVWKKANQARRRSSVAAASIAGL